MHESTPPPELTPESFASMVDHTLLKPEATAEAIERICAEAIDFSTAAVCVNGRWVDVVAAALAGTGIAACSVVGFPLGAMTASSVAAEAADAVERGASEIDMVLSLGDLRTGDGNAASAPISAVREATAGCVLKVILETAVLTDDEIVAACRLAVDAGADFVKTSTGFDPAGGATTHAVSLMRGAVGPDIGIKASGGIRTLADVDALVAAGATRLGMSAAASVIGELHSH